MNERAGPLPVFLLGTYWMYLSFSSPFPDRISMEKGRDTWGSLKEMIEGVGEGGSKTSRVRYEEAVCRLSSEVSELFKHP